MLFFTKKNEMHPNQLATAIKKSKIFTKPPFCFISCLHRRKRRERNFNKSFKQQLIPPHPPPKVKGALI